VPSEVGVISHALQVGAFPNGAMANESERLVREMNALLAIVEEVRTVLQGYMEVSEEVSRRVNEGQLLVSVLDALQGPLRRRQVTEAMAELYVARHRVRLAMFALGAAQGTTASELGRKLGVSRQLAARLANEAAENRSSEVPEPRDLPTPG